MDKIDTWIKDRFGTPNTFNRQLLDNFIEFLEKELGYVIKDPDQGLPEIPIRYVGNEAKQNYGRAIVSEVQEYMLKEHWVKVKEKSNE